MKEFEIQTSDGMVAARSWGDPSLPPVLCLHGWLDNAASFDRIAPLLSSSFYLVAIDLPGHGLSEHRPGWRPYHLTDWLGEVLDAVEHLNWSSFCVLGHSLGGGIGMLMAAVDPTRVERLVMLDSLGPPDYDPDSWVDRLKTSLRQRKSFALGQKKRYSSFESLVEARMSEGALSEESARILMKRGSQEEAGGTVTCYDPCVRMDSALRLSESQVEVVMKKVSVPVLLIESTQGYEYYRKVFERRKNWIPNFEVVRLEGGHHLHLDSPELVAPEVIRFLSASPGEPHD